MINAVPKPKYKRQRKAKNNPAPTIDDICSICGKPYATTHEIYEGSGRRQISIRYGMQVKLCMDCHREVQLHPLQGKDKELKEEYQKKFETEWGSRAEFRRLFGKSYL